MIHLSFLTLQSMNEDNLCYWFAVIMVSSLIVHCALKCGKGDIFCIVFSCSISKLRLYCIPEYTSVSRHCPLPMDREADLFFVAVMTNQGGRKYLLD